MLSVFSNTCGHLPLETSQRALRSPVEFRDEFESSPIGRSLIRPTSEIIGIGAVRHFSWQGSSASVANGRAAVA